jgi:hypothetical protein
MLEVGATNVGSIKQTHVPDRPVAEGRGEGPVQVRRLLRDHRSSSAAASSSTPTSSKQSAELRRDLRPHGRPARRINPLTPAMHGWTAADQASRLFPQAASLLALSEREQAPCLPIARCGSDCIQELMKITRSPSFTAGCRCWREPPWHLRDPLPVPGECGGGNAAARGLTSPGSRPPLTQLQAAMGGRRTDGGGPHAGVSGTHRHDRPAGPAPEQRHRDQPRRPGDGGAGSIAERRGAGRADRCTASRC